MIVNGQVVNTAAQQNGDNTYPLLAVGRNGDLIVSELHGKRYAKAVRGNLFWATVGGTSGTALDPPGGTAGQAVLYNPAGSGVYMEVEKIRLTGASTETVVVSGIGVEGSVQKPSSVTAAAISAFPLGSSAATGGNRCTVYSAATIVAMTYIGGLGLTFTATTSPPGVCEVDLDGTMVLSPGMALNIVSTIDQATAIVGLDVIWSEHPV